MKRAQKQTEKLNQQLRQPTKLSQQNASQKPANKSQNQSQNTLQLTKGGNLPGQVPYKRKQTNENVNYIYSNNNSALSKQMNFQQRSSIQSQSSISSKINLSTNKSGLTSVVKSDLKAKYSLKSKQVSDISEILQDSQQSTAGNTVKASQSKLGFIEITKSSDPFYNQENKLPRNFSARKDSTQVTPTHMPSLCMFSQKSQQSPITMSKVLSRDLNLSPKDSQVLIERQMILRSGAQVSSDKKRVIDSIMDNITSKSNSVKSSNSKKGRLTGTKRLRSDSDYGTEQKLVFPNSALKDCSDKILNSNKKQLHSTLHKIGMSNQKKQKETDIDANKRKSPSVGDIEGASNHYTLKISDITEALQEFQDQEEDVNRSFDLKISPIQNQQNEEFQTLILNQTNATSGGLMSHDFSLSKSSPVFSERNSLGMGETLLNFQQKSDIECLIRNVFMEGKVFWEVKWRNDFNRIAQKYQQISFENQETLRKNYGQEFEAMRTQYLSDKSQIKLSQ
eukprot:403339039